MQCKAFHMDSLEPRRLLAHSLGLLAAGIHAQAGAESTQTPEMGLGLGGVTYYSRAWVFADALKMESRGWMINGQTIPLTQLDANGFPTVTGTFDAIPFQNNAHPLAHPKGIYVVTWEGSGDVTLPGAQLIAGSSAEGRRVYRLNQPSGGGLPIRLVNNSTSDHVRNVHVWMPDPADPNNRSLEPADGQPAPLWHPDYLAHLQADAHRFGWLRFMDWSSTNNNPQMQWSDRRPATHAFATGSHNFKALPVPGGNNANTIGEIGLAWEWIIDLANTLDKDAWINVPHAAGDDYVRNLAQLVAAQLEPGRRVYVEYSNEIWSGGGSFIQGDWARQQATTQGINHPQFVARRSSQIWQIFTQELGTRSADMIRVAGAHTGNPWYTENLLTEAFVYGGSLAQPQQPDQVAVTTYFGGQPIIRYVFNETDWLGVNYNNVDDPAINQAFDHWLNELTLNASDGSREGATGAGGFGARNRDIARRFNLPLVSYEGGPSIYTEGGGGFYLLNNRIVDEDTPGAQFHFSIANYVAANFPDDDTNPWNDDRFTKVFNTMNRHPRFAEIYGANLHLAKKLELRTHAPFVDISGWSKWGQWGHKEYLGQPVGNHLGDAVKWQFLRDWYDDQAATREVGQPLNAAPALPADGDMPSVFAGAFFDHSFDASPGDGVGDDIKYEIVAGKLPEGITMERLSDSSFRFVGSTDEVGVHRVLIRLRDADNDVAYGLYALRVMDRSGQSDTLEVNDDSTASPGGSDTGTGAGTSNTLFVGGRDRRAYLKFDLRNLVSGNIDNATLRIHVNGFENNVGTGAQLWIEAVADDAWTESTLSSVTAPPSGPAVTPTLTIQPGAQFVEFDLTDYVRNQTASGTGDGIVSFALRGTVINGQNPWVAVLVSSRQGDPSRVPTLTIAQSPLDVIPPRVDAQTFDFETDHTLTIDFDDDVAPFLDASDIDLIGPTGAVTIHGIDYNIATNRAIVQFAPGLLANGLYTATVRAAGIKDRAGNPMTSDATLPFHVLEGDANRDRRVDFADLLILAQNYGTSGKTFSQGNFDYSPDGLVDFSDLLIVAQNYNVTLLAGSQASKPATRTRRFSAELLA
jgi:hypothetical protein